MASVGGLLYTLTVIKKRPGVRALKLRGFTYHNLIIGRLYRSLNCMSVIASTRSRNAACPVIPPVHTDPALAHTALQAARKGPESGANQTSSSILGMSEMYWNRSLLGLATTSCRSSLVVSCPLFGSAGRSVGHTKQQQAHSPQYPDPHGIRGRQFHWDKDTSMLHPKCS
jgi:hypothetical protein